MEKLIEGKTFTRADYTLQKMDRATYDNCSFISCSFAGVDLSHIQFVECYFEDCDLSIAKLKHTVFNNIEFEGCKLTGLNFKDCDSFLLSFTFKNCQIQLASFYKVKLKDTLFRKCILHETDFTEADISGSVLEECDLKNAVFSYSVLEKVNMYTSYNYSIDPDINRLKKTVFSKEGVVGLLDKYNIIIK